MTAAVLLERFLFDNPWSVVLLERFKWQSLSTVVLLERFYFTIINHSWFVRDTFCIIFTILDNSCFVICCCCGVFLLLFKRGRYTYIIYDKKNIFFYNSLRLLYISFGTPHGSNADNPVLYKVWNKKTYFHNNYIKYILLNYHETVYPC
jgi:hypothetical protein